MKMKQAHSKGWLALMIISLFLSACGSNQEESRHIHGNGDVREETASADVLPAFLDGQREEIRLVYQAAGKAADILQWMPCYCGCADSAGHQSNLNCFIHQVNSDGSVVWDDHGTRCGVCLDIAVQSITMKQEGKSLKEIRQAIDETYQEGYAKPTPTPMPAAS
jgi:hypothetical protein